MDIKEHYGIFFQRILMLGQSYPDAVTTNENNYEIVNHLTKSDKKVTELQIAALQEAMNGKLIQEDWGEVMGSSLDIYQTEGTVQIGYTNRRISIQDFKQLLEEWLKFIS